MDLPPLPQGWTEGPHGPWYSERQMRDWAIEVVKWTMQLTIQELYDKARQESEDPLTVERMVLDAYNKAAERRKKST